MVQYMEVGVCHALCLPEVHCPGEADETEAKVEEEEEA